MSYEKPAFNCACALCSLTQILKVSVMVLGTPGIGVKELLSFISTLRIIMLAREAHYTCDVMVTGK